MQEMIGLERAQEILLSFSLNKKKISLGLLECRERVLAETLDAVLDIPPFDRSPLDGYAIQGEDTLGILPVGLRLIGESPAGSVFAGVVEAGKAVRVLTGSPMPAGANSVIRQEDTQESENGVKILTSVQPGSNISRRGEDIARGEELVGKGTIITPSVIGILASQGLDKVKVFERPRVAIASTGDELVDVGKALSPGQIYNTNLYTLAALIESWGGNPLSLGLVKDSEEELAKAIDLGLEKSDLVVTTGGASVGTYDVTLRAMQRAGIEILFWRVAMKPGTPVVCGQKGGKLVLGLSGNPAAAMISAHLLVAPVVRKQSGFNCFLPKRVSAACQRGFDKTSGVRRMIRASVAITNLGFTVTFSQGQKPGVLKSMLGSNALIDLPPGQMLSKGNPCEVLLLEEWQ